MEGNQGRKREPRKERETEKGKGNRGWKKEDIIKDPTTSFRRRKKRYYTDRHRNMLSQPALYLGLSGSRAIHAHLTHRIRTESFSYSGSLYGQEEKKLFDEIEVDFSSRVGQKHLCT